MERNARFDVEGEHHRAVEVLCECGRAGCADRVEVTREIYERLRADPETFVLTPGHEEGVVETVIERTPAYVVARNIGEAARIALDGDPRLLRGYPGQKETAPRGRRFIHLGWGGG